MKQQIVPAKLPTLEQAKKVANFITRPLNNQVVLVGAVAPKVSTSGVVVGKSFQEKSQEELNRRGVLVVHAPDTQNTKIEEGEVVLFRPETQLLFSRVITSNELHDGLDLDENSETTPDMFKQYVILVINASDLMLVLNNSENGA